MASHAGTAPVTRSLDVDDVPIAVLGFAGGELVAANRHWVELTGLELDVSTGSGWLTAVHSDDWVTARHFIQTAARDEAVAEWRVLSMGGRDAAWVQATSALLGPAGGTFVVALSEIDSHKADEESLRHRASHDSLTGLLNHGAFMTRVEAAVELAAAQFGMCAVLYLDLDHFKVINDTFGHQTGDRLLVAVSRRIRSSLRPSDTLARLGGDEIGVLCPLLDHENDATHLAARIVETIGAPFTIDERAVHTSVSIGVASSNGGELTASGLVEQADQAMYRAKMGGRAQWATTTARSVVIGQAEPADVRDVLGSVIQARRRLDDLVRRIDLKSVDWDRLAQASRALQRANALLEGDARIG